MLTITAIGGYNEVGRNMTLLQYDDEAVILDMGLHVENYIRFTEEEDIRAKNTGLLIRAGALPEVGIIDMKAVKAIITTHGHLDHIGGIPFLAKKYPVPIYATRYTIEVIKKILEDERITLPNELVAVEENGTVKLSEHLEAEFIHITHSIPQATLVLIKTPEGNVLYGNDFKLDNYPTLGKPPNYARFRKVKVKALISESLYVTEETKTPPEESVRLMLKDVMGHLKGHDGLIIATTFSSHIARLKTIVQEAKVLKRKILIAGRSLSRYVMAARAAGIYDFNDAHLVKYANELSKALKTIAKDPSGWILVCTGHQGEPRSVLSRIASGAISLDLEKTVIIFSCRTIPTETNIANRKKLEDDLASKGARIIKDVHASGHASQEDLREFYEMVKPELIIPSHSTHLKYFKEHFPDYHVELMNNGNSLQLD